MHSITVWLQISSNQTENFSLNFSLFHALGAEYDTNCKIAVNYSYKSEAALDSWLDRTFNITLLDNLHEVSRGTGIKQLQSRLGCCRRPALAHAVVSFETTQRYVPTVWGCDRWKWFRTIFVFFLKLLPPAAKCLLGNEHGYECVRVCVYP